MSNKNPQIQDDIPWDELSAPAQRALAGAGFRRLADFIKVTEYQVMQLHGVGQKSLRTLNSALAARGLSFTESRTERC